MKRSQAVLGVVMVGLVACGGQIGELDTGAEDQEALGEVVGLLQSPTDIAVDGSGNVFVIDGTRIIKVLPTGARRVFADLKSYPRILGMVANRQTGDLYVALPTALLK